MSEAPEKIIIRAGHLGPFVEERWFGDNQPVEYVRANRIEKLEAEVKRLEQQLKMARRLAHRRQPEYPPEIGVPHLRED